MNLGVIEQKRWLLPEHKVPQPWQRLGAGGFGEVFSAKLNGITPVAVKHVRIEDNMTPNQVDEVLITDFYNESILLCGLQGPHLLHFYGVFWTDPPSPEAPVLDFYMVLELAAGGDLRRLLYDYSSGRMAGPKPRMSNETLQRLIIEMFAGLSFLHENGIIHRDLKPDNIMLSRPIEHLDAVPSPILKIIDFGHR